MEQTITEEAIQKALIPLNLTIVPFDEEVDWRVSKHLQKGLSLPFLFFDNRARL